jgi:hypothetical protein
MREHLAAAQAKEPLSVHSRWMTGWLTVKTGSLYGAIAAVGVLHAAGMIALLIWAPRGVRGQVAPHTLSGL